MDEFWVKEDATGEEDEKKPLAPVELTARDIAIFKLAHEHRYIVHSQIREGFWRGRSVHAKSPYKRIGRLINNGYLERGYSGRLNLNCYFVTERSLAILKERGLDSGLELYQRTECFDRSIDHDLKVLNLRILFRDLGLASWTSERVIREIRHASRIPDGILNVGGKKIAIEFENVGLTKEMVRYQAMLDDYSESGEYALLFIIVDGNVKDWIVRVMDYDVKRIWVTMYSHLMKKKERARFENKAATFTLSEIL